MQAVRLILLVVSCGCGSWLLALRKTFGMSWSENTALEKIFGPKSAEVVGDWRKLHSHQLH